MAYELYDADSPERGLGYLLAKIESTYGTDPTPAAADAVLVESFRGDYQREPIRRGLKSAYRMGARSYSGRAHCPYTWSQEIGIGIIADPPVSGNAPTADQILRCGGFLRTLGGAGQTSIGYFLASHGHESATVYDYWTNDQADDENRLKINGCRHNINGETASDGRLILTGSGFGIPQSTLANTFASSGAAPTANIVYPVSPPLIFQGARVRLHRHGSATPFGGGTLASPTNAASLLSWSFDAAWQVTEELGGHSPSGVARVSLRSNPQSPPLVTFVVEATDESEWSWLTQVRDGDTMAFDVRTVAAETSTRTGQVLANGQVVDCVQGAEGRRTWQCTMECRWPEDASDGDPAVGTSPEQAFTVGTNEGLDEVPTGGTPPPSMLAILIDAAS